MTQCWISSTERSPPLLLHIAGNQFAIVESTGFSGSSLLLISTSEPIASDSPNQLADPSSACNDSCETSRIDLELRRVPPPSRGLEMGARSARLRRSGGRTGPSSDTKLTRWAHRQYFPNLVLSVSPFIPEPSRNDRLVFHRIVPPQITSESPTIHSPLCGNAQKGFPL
jgi:hypothetical protein